jgi:thiamine biosynthesis protein ThiS
MPSDKVTIVANGESQEITAPGSVLDFLKLCGWKPTQVVVEHNGKVIERDRLQLVQLRNGDRLEVIVPVAGG